MDWLADHLWALWLGLAIVLGVAEMASLDLVLLMLAVGALTGVATAAIGLPFAAQVLIASGVSVAALFAVRPAVARRLHAGPDLRLGHHALIGESGRVLQPISVHEPGQVKVRGEIWTARPYDDHETIEIGATVDILEIRGATALVIRRDELPGGI